jgi:hypothetical protein
MDPVTHKRFLDYRAAYEYFGEGVRARKLSAEEFAAFDAELRALTLKGEGRRDDEEEARHTELLALLLRD